MSDCQQFITSCDRGQASEVVAPPSTNRGVLSTLPSNESDFLIHWLSCTFPFEGYDTKIDENGEVIFYPDIFGDIEFLFGDVELMERNLYRGYSRTALLECGGRVAWHETNADQKLLVDISGSALAELDIPIQELITLLFNAGATFTRLDVARDDFEGVLSLAEIERCLMSGEITTRFRRGRTVHGFQFGENSTDGYTIYVGSAHSSAQFRFYDKRIEQIQKGKEVDCDHWIRCEGQFRSEVAEKLAEGISQAAEKVGEFLGGVFLNYLDFKEPGQDSNRSRWSTTVWWSAFLAASEKVRLGLGRAARKLQEAQQWIAEQVAVVLGTINIIDRSWIEEAVTAGQQFMANKPKHKKRLDRWRSDFDREGSYKFKLSAA